MKAILRSPWLELLVMSAVVLVAFGALMLITAGAERPADGMSLSSVSLIVFGFFLLSFAIAVIAVMAGIGGGVLFTPLMLAFTPVDSMVIRGTGIIVAMFSGLISSRPFLRKGLGNLKLSMYSCLGYGVGAFAGAQGAVSVSRSLGAVGEGTVRICLGFIVLFLAAYFFYGGIKIEYPQARGVGQLGRKLNFSHSYVEESTGQRITYTAVRIGWGLIAMVGIGMVSGFFGLGAGWAIVPAFNLIMGAPLKAAAACSGVLIGMGDCVSVWPYILNGAVIPLFASLWLVGQVLGGIVGSQVLIRIQVKSIRLILIGIMLFSSFGLLTKGLAAMEYISPVPAVTQLIVLVCIIGCVAAGIIRRTYVGRKK